MTWSSIRKAYRRTLSAAFHSRAFRVFSLCYLFATLYLILTGNGWAVRLNAPEAGWIVGTILLMIPFTVHKSEVSILDSSTASRPRLIAQTALIITFILFMYPRQHHFIATAMLHIPPLQFVGASLSRHPELLQEAMPPIFLFCLPLLILRRSGANLKELGLGQGYRPWLIASLWSLIPCVIILSGLIAGHMTPHSFLSDLIHHVVHDGFFEEFLFRGALMTRLGLLMGADWGSVISAFAFGAWHLCIDIPMLGGNFMAGVADCIIDQTFFGLGAAIVVLWSGNLLACSVAHVLGNVSGM